MSYQLAFWKTSLRLQPRKVFAKAMANKRVRGLEPLDVMEVEKRLFEAFKGWSFDSTFATSRNQIAFSRDGAAVDVHPGEQVVVFTCYGLRNDELNRIIDVMNAMGTPLYDPQTRERFDL